MLTPYDWQENIGHRAQYIEGRLAKGTPVVALSVAEGILFWTKKRQSRKLFEIYDKLGFGAIGLQSDVEAIRNAAIDFASREGYQRSEEDVTIKRIATAVSQPLKRAFADFSSAPFVARCLFGEVHSMPDDDQLAVLDYAGDYTLHPGFAVIAGTQEATDNATELFNLNHGKKAGKIVTLNDARAELETAFEKFWEQQYEGEFKEEKEQLKTEALLLSRSNEMENRFTLLAE